MYANVPPSHSGYVERSYTLHRVPENPDIDYLRHPSGVIVLQLAATHPVLGKEVESVDFDPGSKKKGKDRTKQSVVGKGKKPDTKLCLIHTTDGQQFTVRAGLRATLIEVNAQLVEQPRLLQTSRQKRGYIAIVIPPAILQHEKNKVPRQFGPALRVGDELPMPETKATDVQDLQTGVDPDHGSDCAPEPVEE